MADKAKLIDGLQTIVTDLEQQAAGHDIQSRIFASQGFSKLSDKYKEHAEDERGYVQKCTDRILDLGGEVKLEAKKAAPVYTDAIEYIKYDLQVSKDGLKTGTQNRCNCSEKKIYGGCEVIHAPRFLFALFSEDCLLCYFCLQCLQCTLN